MYDPKKLHVIDPLLSNFSLGYQDQQLYGLDIFPAMPVGNMSGRYRIFDRSNWLIYPDRREPGTVANEISGGKWSEDVFAIKEHSLQAAVLDEEREELAAQGAVEAAEIDPEQDAVETLTRSLLLRHEKLVADTVRNTANYAAGHTVTLAGAQQWNDYTNGVTSTSVPVADFKKAMDKVFRDTGRMPNTAVFSYDAWVQLVDHPRIVDRFKNFTLTEPSAFEQLTGFSGRIIVADSVYNSADNVDATESIVSLWGQDVWVGIVDPTPGQKTKTFGKTFQRAYPSGDMRPVDTWREDPRKADIFRCSWRWDIKIVSNVAGYLIKNAVAVPS